MKPCLFVLLLFHCFIHSAFAQEKNDDYYKQLEEEYKKLRDSLSRAHPFIPAVSSVMIDHRQTELNIFNSLITSNRYRDGDGDLNDINSRQTYFYNTIQLTYGLSAKSRFNIGLDINSVMGRVDENRNSSMFKVFSSGVEGNSEYARAVTSVAPRIRWRPLKRSYNLTIQSSIGIPTGISTKKQEVLGFSQVYFLTQFLYNEPLGKRLFLFSQLSLQYSFQRDNAPAVFYTPVSVYLSYLVPKKTIVFALANYVPIFTRGSDYRCTFQAGGGAQYQVSQHILINGYYAHDITGKNYPDFSSYSLSIRFMIR